MKIKIIECDECVKYSDYYKKGYFKREMLKVGDVGTGILYQCPNKECNRLKIICLNTLKSLPLVEDLIEK